LAGLSGIPRLLIARRAVQQSRSVSDAQLMSILSPVAGSDEME
jgi:hypothetical protein